MDLQPTFYYAFGNALGSEADEFDLVRYYFHLEPSGAPALIHYFTLELNRYRVPFRLKVLDRPSLYNRCDAGVLYVAKRYVGIASMILFALPSEVDSALRASIPLFTKRLGAGVGYAEDPRNGESFGLHRCRLLAEALVTGFLTDTSGAGLWEIAVKRFAAEGLSIQRPYLNCGSIDPFENRKGSPYPNA
jgi:hypothetical protein